MVIGWVDVEERQPLREVSYLAWLHKRYERKNAHDRTTALCDLTVSDYEIGLVQLIGKPIANIRGYLSDLGGGPTFKLTKIEFADGTFLGVEGEHDFPYLVTWGTTSQPQYDEATLEALMHEQEGTEEESA